MKVSPQIHIINRGRRLHLPLRTPQHAPTYPRS